MVTITEDIKDLKLKLKDDIDHLDSDKIKKVSSFIADLAADDLTKIADEVWDKGDLSREKISEAVKSFRDSKKK